MTTELAQFAVLAATTGSAKAVAWICFGVGIALVLGGAALAVYITVFVKGSATNIDRAKQALDDAARQALLARDAVQSAGRPGAEAAAGTAAVAADAAATKAATAKSALEQVGGIVASLPENARVAGMLVLVGTVLVSVATIQFGGVSLF